MYAMLTLVLAAVWSGPAKPEAICPLAAEPRFIDAVLRREDDRHGTLGPSGARLWADRLEPAPGLRGRFAFVHPKGGAITDPLPITFTVDGEPAEARRTAVTWYPSRLECSWELGPLALDETKFITWGDLGACLFLVRNPSGEPHTLSAALEPIGSPRLEGGSFPAFGTRIGVRRWLEPESLRLGPGEEATFLAAFAVFVEGEEPPAPPADPKALLAGHIATYNEWFRRNVPHFDCPDEAFNRLWYYRWYLARWNLVEPRLGNLTHPVFYEGKHGDWFPTVITFSSPHIIAETRWLADERLWQGQALTHAEHMQEGYYRCVRADWIGKFYTNWISAAAWEALLVRPEESTLRRLAPAMLADLKGTLAAFDPDGDLLPAPPSHWRTGMEWQPSFFYFSGYRTPEGEGEEARLERVDFASYLWANARAASLAAAKAGDADGAKRAAEIADKVRAAVLAKMWVREEGKGKVPGAPFFFSIREDDDAPALVREIVGFYPYAFGLVPEGDERYRGGLRPLLDRSAFATPVPVATVERSCPAYSPHPSTWPVGKGGSRCTWNGPVWPHANSLALRALVEGICRYEEPGLPRSAVWEFLRAYTLMQLEGGDPGRPLTLEYYDAQSGEGVGCLDYFHSTYNDLIIRCVAGLVPRDDDVIELDPLVEQWDHFAFEGIPYRGHRLDIVWQRPVLGTAGRELPYPGVPDGYCVYLDGRLAVSFPFLTKARYDMKTGRVEILRKEPFPPPPPM